MIHNGAITATEKSQQTNKSQVSHNYCCMRSENKESSSAINKNCDDIQNPGGITK